MPDNPSGGFSLVHLGDLTKPATVLIERVSDFIGGVFAPIQVKRMAKGQAEARITDAIADLQISELQRRAFVRVAAEEERNQANIENITGHAIRALNTTATPENIDNDWLVFFFEKSRIVSNSEMQTLWGKLLAGEANQPGAFSRQTISCVSILDRGDADVFTKLSRFCWSINGELQPLVFDYDEPVYGEEGINFDVLTHLETLGLVTFDATTPFVFKAPRTTVQLEYFGRGVSISQNPVSLEPSAPLEIGSTLLTRVGQELAPISGATPKDSFFSYVLSTWNSHTWLATEIGSADALVRP